MDCHHIITLFLLPQNTQNNYFTNSIDRVGRNFRKLFTSVILYKASQNNKEGCKTLHLKVCFHQEQKRVNLNEYVDIKS